MEYQMMCRETKDDEWEPAFFKFPCYANGLQEIGSEELNDLVNRAYEAGRQSINENKLKVGDIVKYGDETGVIMEIVPEYKYPYKVLVMGKYGFRIITVKNDILEKRGKNISGTLNELRKELKED